MPGEGATPASPSCFDPGVVRVSVAESYRHFVGPPLRPCERIDQPEKAVLEGGIPHDVVSAL